PPLQKWLFAMSFVDSTSMSASVPMPPDPLTSLHRKGGGQGRNWRRGPYNNRRWRRRRQYQLRTQPLCEFCLAEGLVRPADTVDHVEPHGGDYQKFWYGPVRSLCRSCHERLHHRANENPWIDPATGWPLPPEQQAERERQSMAVRFWENIDDGDEN